MAEMEFPRWMHHPIQGSELFFSPERLASRGDGWCNTPDDFPKEGEPSHEAPVEAPVVRRKRGPNKVKK